MENEGRWVTINGAHVLLKDGKKVEFNNKNDEIREYSVWKVKKIRQFIDKIVKEVNEFNSERHDPWEAGISNSDIQSMVEAFIKENEFDDRDGSRILSEIRQKTEPQEELYIDSAVKDYYNKK